ncbi:hypothetical protein PoB_000150700 [Plakobranchus ocellatus]|uniref:Uncharacterized protein n=1 Tax=Plakobranchus ocellatus TaxID=259542 RepID=A0AAV3XX16_9GAST|nr:hypothetical protein PoB_000150700 [Plakobranchus ocellatus]
MSPSESRPRFLHRHICCPLSYQPFTPPSSLRYARTEPLPLELKCPSLPQRQQTPHERDRHGYKDAGKTRRQGRKVCGGREKPTHLVDTHRLGQYMV